MTDRIPGSPGRYQAMFTDGELAGKEFTVTLRRDDAPIAEGTPYNKANVLPDALASQLCPGMEDPAPKDAFAALQAGKADIGRRKSGSKITLRDAASAPVTGLRIFGHAAGDGCIGDKGDITVKFAGKNIADIYGFSAVGLNTPESTRILTNGYGTTISTTEPGNTLTITQTQCPKPNNVSFENGYFVIGFYHKIKDGETITVSFDVEITNDLSGNDIFGFMVSGVQYQSAPIINGKVKATFQWKNYGDRQYLEVENHGKSMIISNIQIEYGNTATDYEPYREPQTITVPTPGGLEGDELVQDEIDFEKGVLIRRVFENSEIPLPADVLEAYGKLRTYAPTTIITNDEDADMEVHYCTPQTAVLVSQNPYIVEQGEWIDVSAEVDPGEGTYRKLGNGLATAGGTFTCVQEGMLESSQLYSSFYEYDGIIVFPFEFAQTPVVNLTLEPDSNYHQISVTKVNTKYAAFKIITNSSRDVSAKYNASVIGVWK